MSLEQDTGGLVLTRSEKSEILLFPHFIRKTLLSDLPEWRSRFEREVTSYKLFQEFPTNFRHPHLHRADVAGPVCLLELERLFAEPITVERYLQTALSARRVTEVVELSDQVSHWNVPKEKLAPWSDVRERINRYRLSGFLDEEDSKTLFNLSSLHDPTQWLPGHGDFLLRNVLVLDKSAAQTATLALIDFEFLGLYPASYDLALFWITSMFVPDTQIQVLEQIRHRCPDAFIGFLLSAGLLLARELRIHKEELNRTPPFQKHDEYANILFQLERLWADWRTLSKSFRRIF